MYPHRIRLRGPWECEPLARWVDSAGGSRQVVTELLPAPRRVTMPCHWHDAGLEGFAGWVRCRRRFGYPGRIDADERVWLTFAGFSQSADIVLNGQTLGARTQADCPCELAITSLLQPRNELIVTVESATGADGLWGEVALEIRRTAFLQGVRAELERSAAGVHLRIAGQVIGTSVGPLDLYVLVADQTVAYTTVAATEAGTPFALQSEPLEQDRARGETALVRVELVEGGVIWYWVETLNELASSE